MKLKRNIENYETSQDFGLLYDLAQRSSVICIANYEGCRDIAHTIADERGYVHISCRGTCYADGRNKKEFVADCERQGIAFIPPNVKGLAPATGGAAPTVVQ